MLDLPTDAQEGVALAYAEGDTLDAGLGTYGLPTGLDTLALGPAFAALVAAVDVDRLSGHDQIRLLRAQQRLASHLAAQLYRTMAAVVDTISEEDDYGTAMAEEAAAAEIGAALHLTRRAADIETAFALDLRRRLPVVWEAMSAGRLDARRARVLVNGTDHLPIGLARQVTDQVIGDAGGLTTGQLTARLRRLCVEADPDQATERYQQAIDNRRVVMEPSVDGTAHLFAMDLPPDRLAAGLRRMDQMARSLSGPHETRSMDQRRADVLLDVLTGADTATNAVRGTVDLTVDLTTLTKLNHHPGDLAGFGPVVADVARRTVAAQHDAQWRFTVTDPATGDVVHTGTTRYRPTAAERRSVHARYRSCVFPGCRMPAGQCDLDHALARADGGPTCVGNLAPLCRHHHRIKHTHHWRYRRLPDGTHQWTSALGHTYAVSPRPP